MSGTISGTVTSTYTLTSQYTTILATGAVLPASGRAIDGPPLAGSGWTLVNSGTIVTTAAVQAGIRLKGLNDHVINRAGGVMDASYDVVSFYGNNPTIVNYGAIGLASGKRAVLLQSPGMVTNSGTAARIFGDQRAVYFNSGGTLTNDAGATISGGTIGVWGRQGVTTLANAGLIEGGSAGIDLITGAKLINQANGTIASANGIGADFKQSTYISGGVVTLDNAGTIAGGPGEYAVRLPAGFANRLIDRPGAIFTGLIEGGNTIGAAAISTLELASAAAAGTISNIGARYLDFAQITVDADANWLFAGTNAVAAGATLANSGIITVQYGALAAAGALVNNGAILVDPSTLTAASLLGAGSVTIEAGSTLEAQGTVGADQTIMLDGNNADLLIDSPASFAGTIAGFASGRLIVLPTIAHAATDTATLVGTNTLELATTAGTFDLLLNPAEDFTGHSFTLSDDGGGTGISVVAATTISTTITSTYMLTTPFTTILASGAVLPAAGPAIVGPTLTGSGWTLENSGAVVNTNTAQTGIRLEGLADRVINQETGVIDARGDALAFYGADAALLNHGSIGAPTSNRAVLFLGSGKLTNSGTAAYIAGGAGGVYFNAGGTLTNDAGATISGGTIGVSGSLGATTITNAGLIAGAGTGIDLAGGGVLVNQAGGTITSLNGIAADFYRSSYVGGGPVTLSNYGTIAAINGAVAIRFHGNGDDRLIDHPGAIFIGTVDGGNANTLELASGPIQGTIADLDSAFANFGATTIDPGADWLLLGSSYISGGRTLTNSGTLTLSGAVLSGAGTLVNDGTVSLAPGSGSEILNGTIAGSGTIEVGSNDELYAALAVAAGQTIAVVPTARLWIQHPTDFHGTISGLSQHGTITFPILSHGTTDTAILLSGNTLEIVTGAGTVDLLLDPGEDFSADTFALTKSGSGSQLIVACFAAGTHITVEGGQLPVEQLSKGDLVPVEHGKHSEPVLWIGHRHIDCASHPEPHKVWPVRISAGAFGTGRPCRDLWLSPDHTVFVADVLIPVKHLINGSSIAQVRANQVTYYHVELPRHAVLMAEGLPVESYLDTGNRSIFENSGELITLYPDLASRVWEAEGCAPLIVAGPELEAVRRWVIDLAAAGTATTVETVQDEGRTTYIAA